MPFEPILPRIRAAAARGTLSHALLLTGTGDRLAAARFAAAAHQCTGSAESRPCGACLACRKVQEDIHPDVITVQDSEHKLIAVDVLRDIRKDAYIRPNEGRRKVYLFPDCALLSEQGQNLLLKLVEEGPPYAAFLFCAENPAVVLQTLRSRCVELKLRPALPSAGGDGEDLLCRTLIQKKPGGLVELAARLERQKLTREALAGLLETSRTLVSQALFLGCGHLPGPENRELAERLGQALTKSQLMRIIETLQKYHQECGYNVGPGHVLGALAAELEGIL